MMRRHAPAALAAVLFVAVAVAAAAFAFRTSIATRQDLDPPTPATPAASDLTSSFSLVDSQPKDRTATITPLQRVYDTPQLGPGTQGRLRRHDSTGYVAPPEYLLSRGIVRVRDAGKRVAFTFDDGPSANTAEILRILSKYDVRATFFMIGARVQVSPDLARAVIAQGSELGNHTMAHSELRDQSRQADEYDIMSADEAIFKATGAHPIYVRPKGGQLDDDGIAAITDLNRIFVYWDVASFDTVKDFTPADIRDNVLEDVRPGSVVLFHETNPKTAQALPQIIEGLRRRGYAVQSLTELLR